MDEATVSATQPEETADTSAATETEAQSEQPKSHGPVVRLLDTLQESLLPHPNYAPGEIINQVIHMAPYRATIPKVLALLGVLVLFLAVFAVVFLTITGPVNPVEQPEQQCPTVYVVRICRCIVIVYQVIANRTGLQTMAIHYDRSAHYHHNTRPRPRDVCRFHLS